MAPLLEIIALGAPDAVAAEDGGADRIELVASMDADGLSPDPAVVEAIRRRTRIPMRVMLRESEGFTTTPAELTRLRVLARDYAAAGADGFVLGFLTPTLEVDVAAVLALVEGLDGLPWTFHRAVDHALGTDKAWWTLRDLPGMTTVLTAGSARGVEAGMEDLAARARSERFAASRIMAGGGLRAEHVPWLAQAGVRAFHVGSAVRPDQSWKAYVDPAYVRSWRTVIDDEVARAADVAAGEG
ncbi:copper homeostasis protein CutC [Actinopolymorpha alba]|uniref:copper homeostasis protein CutC n=1 Tax=Actinopolymorpha alba TaxID=533267 RepID=UPI0003699701|nr:copper homeostasis protein CutC [Actinopolymorpha alba]